MEKEDIDFGIVGELAVSIGEEVIEGAEQIPVQKNPDIPLPPPKEDYDPLWEPAYHDNKLCEDKEGCKEIVHYGAEEL